LTLVVSSYYGFAQGTAAMTVTRLMTSKTTISGPIAADKGNGWLPTLLSSAEDAHLRVLLARLL
jgi:hypothetical protein